MYGHVIPVGSDSHINMITYPVELPEYALPKALAYETGEIQEISIPDKNAIVYSRITIAQMIDFCYRVIKFRILYADDIIEVYRVTTEYASGLSAYGEFEEAAAYLAKVRLFLTKMTPSLNILSKRREDARTILFSKSLMDLFASQPGEIPK